jgi:hypothetical protein
MKDGPDESPKKGALLKAIIVLDLYGQCANYHAILDTSRDYSVERRSSIFLRPSRNAVA